MKLKIIQTIVGIAAAFLIATSFNNAYAFFGGGDDITNNITNHGGKGGDGGDAKASAKACSSSKSLAFSMGWYDNDVKVKNTNRINNKDINVNLVKGSEQGQKQGQTAHNEGIEQDVTVEGDVYKTPKSYNHIQPVSGPDTDSETVRSAGHDALTFGGIMNYIDGLYADEAKKLASDAGDVEILEAVFFEPNESVNYVRVGVSGKFAGFLYAVCEDTQCSAAGMDGKAMATAAKLGFTHISLAYKSSGEKLKASEWSVKLGGGASVAADGGKMMIAPGGGIGGGAAESMTTILPARVYRVFIDPLFIKVD